MEHNGDSFTKFATLPRYPHVAMESEPAKMSRFRRLGLAQTIVG